jgi:hypothetical protein
LPIKGDEGTKGKGGGGGGNKNTGLIIAAVAAAIWIYGIVVGGNATWSIPGWSAPDGSIGWSQISLSSETHYPGDDFSQHGWSGWKY